MPLVPPVSELKQRLKNFREKLKTIDCDGALITDSMNVRYLSGFTGHSSALLITARQKLLLTNGIYAEEAQNSAKGWAIKLEPPSLFRKCGVFARKIGVQKLAIEPENITLAQQKILKKNARGVKLIARPNMVGELRIFKSDWEVKQIQNAIRIQEKCFTDLCKTKLKPGITEQEFSALLRYRMVQAGADDQAFDLLIQFGPNASLPHGQPTNKKLKSASNVLIDWGARYGGYHGDLTRSFFIGKIPPRLREIHETVRVAQSKAIKAVGPGVSFAEVDEAARAVIREAGYGKAFSHSTGHGLGLYIHEAPSLSSQAKGELKPGMVVTVEPGIYIPGLGGVRIEDDVLVTEKGHRVLSRLPIGLRWDGGND